MDEGRAVDRKEPAEITLSLQATGCHNINLANPTRVAPRILNAQELAVSRDLYLPLVYNAGGYDSLETLQLVDESIDIYMSGMKYSDF